MRRVRAVVVGLAWAVALFWVGGLFGLNGTQWDWWRGAAYAAAGLTLVGSVFRSSIAAAAGRWSRPLVVGAIGVAGAAILGASLAVMAVRYGDPYAGRLFWPHALAVFGGIGFALAAIAAAASSVTSR
jgi:hypothetical protein